MFHDPWIVLLMLLTNSPTMPRRQFIITSKLAYISFGVTAILARTISRGYVIMAAVVPAMDPASNLGTGGRALQPKKGKNQSALQPFYVFT